MGELGPQGRIGTVLAGTYRLEEVLGEGAHGVVYRGAHVGTSRRVAVKVLRERSEEADRVKVERFFREARAAAQLRHPNVISVLDVDQAKDGTVFQVLELLEGETLADLLDREGRLSLVRTHEILDPVLGALAHAHAAGVVHRDLKPENIFLSRDREGQVVPKLLDFGIAKLDSVESLTCTGTILGTPAFMAPEQARAERDVDGGADLWAMGGIFYRCLTGRLPYEGRQPMRVILAILESPAPRIDEGAPDLSPAVARVIQSALEKDRAARGKDLAGFRRRLREAIEGRGTEAEPEEEAAGDTIRDLPPTSGASTTLGTTPRATAISSLHVGWLALAGAGALLTLDVVLGAIFAW